MHKGTLAGVLAHLRNLPPVRAGISRQAFATSLGVALMLASCGFSGSLYLPEEEPPPSEEQPADETGGEPAAATPN